MEDVFKPDPWKKIEGKRKNKFQSQWMEEGNRSEYPTRQ
jgi:hypothetical protein